MDDLDPAYREAFDFLRDETRLRILLTLAEANRRAVGDADAARLSFSELRDKADVADSGRFNYHLDKLRDTLVERLDATDDAPAGYVLSPAGLQAVSAVVAGAFAAGERREPVATDLDCPECGERLDARYERGLLVLSCANEHTHSNLLPPGTAADRSMSDLLEIMRLTTQQDLELAVAGICPLCRGPFSWQFRPANRDVANEPTFAGACQRCSVPFSADPAMIIARHPAVVSFYHRHGIDVRDRHNLEFAADVRERTLVSTAPPRLRLRLAVADETLSVTLDGEGTVVAVDGPTAAAD